MRPHHESIERRSQSLHYFNVRDRVDLSSFSDSFPTIDVKNLPLQNMLPSSTNFSSLCSKFAVLVARVLTENLKSFSVFGDIVSAHIQHRHQEDMSLTKWCQSWKSFIHTFQLSTVVWM